MTQVASALLGMQISSYLPFPILGIAHYRLELSTVLLGQDAPRQITWTGIPAVSQTEFVFRGGHRDLLAPYHAQRLYWYSSIWPKAQFSVAL